MKLAQTRHSFLIGQSLESVTKCACMTSELSCVNLLYLSMVYGSTIVQLSYLGEISVPWLHLQWFAI